MNEVTEVVVRRDLIKKEFERYEKVMKFLECDVPIQALCLPKQIEKHLLSAGCLRVFDMIDRDLTKIKGIGKVRGAFLRSRLNEFFPVGF